MRKVEAKVNPSLRCLRAEFAKPQPNATGNDQHFIVSARLDYFCTVSSPPNLFESNLTQRPWPRFRGRLCRNMIIWRTHSHTTAPASRHTQHTQQIVKACVCESRNAPPVETRCVRTRLAHLQESLTVQNEDRKKRRCENHTQKNTQRTQSSFRQKKNRMRKKKKRHNTTHHRAYLSFSLSLTGLI